MLSKEENKIKANEIVKKISFQCEGDKTILNFVINGLILQRKNI